MLPEDKGSQSHISTKQGFYIYENMSDDDICGHAEGSLVHFPPNRTHSLLSWGVGEGMAQEGL